MKANADSIQGWQLLSQLQLQNQQYDLAAESAAKGLKCLHQRQKRGYSSQPAIAAGIVLARAHSLLHLGLSDDAVALFKALTGEPPLAPPPLPPSLLSSYPRAPSRLPSLYQIASLAFAPVAFSCSFLVNVAITHECWSDRTLKGQGQHMNGMTACMIRHRISLSIDAVMPSMRWQPTQQ